MTSITPIIPGFYPDPSICRVDDAYYIVNSSFEYLPGLPIHRSTDLVTWVPVGNALDRADQIDEHAGAPSSGVYAPTLRHHDGRFWIVGTNVLDLQRGRGHFIISAEDAAGRWSEPVFTDGVVGIDPDLAWDEDGRCHLTWASFAPDLPGIVSAIVDPYTGELLTEPTRLWQGTGLAHPEGPHLYRRDGWWYLLLAEGGTERGHVATVARARTLDDDFEAAPGNPLLSHRSTDNPVQNVGHADMVELADGSWAAVHLGVRPSGQTPGFHVNGRETFLVGIDWVDGWPRIDEDRFLVSSAAHSFLDEFASLPLHTRWVGAGRFPSSFTRHVNGGIVIEAPTDGGGVSMLATRVQDAEWTSEVTVDISHGTAMFELRIDAAHAYGFRVDNSTIEAAIRIGPSVSIVGRAEAPSSGNITLRIGARLPEHGPYLPANEPDLIDLAVVDSDGEERVLGTYDGRYVATEVAGGFTGRMLGVQAALGEVTVRRFVYTTA